MEFDKIKYNNEYNKKNYKEYKIRVRKEYENKIAEHYKKRGYTSLNSYINELIKKDMEGGGTAEQESS